METKKYRYPGLQPFKSDQANIFYGREKEIEEFCRFVLTERLIVLYAKSGMGKSSLLNAGVIPRIQKEGHYQTVNIRFKSFASKSNENPIQLTQLAIANGVSPATFLDELVPDNGSLWHEAKEQQFLNKNEIFGLFLVFDQFEELFTYPEETVKAFKEQLAELLFTQIPQKYRDALRKKGGNLTEDEREKLHQQVDVRVVLAIRSDRLEQLKQISDSLPIQLNKNCYELVPLTRKQAEDAILNPAYKRDDEFASPVFDYEDEAIEAILNFLTDGNKEHIESFQLQILCQSVERKVMETGKTRISRADLGNIETVYENYYEDELKSIKDPLTYEAAKVFIEDGLLFDDDKEPRRLSLYEGQIERDFGISKTVLDQLVNCRLLRAELSPLGGLTYELSHDTLLTPVQKSKRRRDEVKKAKAQEAENQRIKEERQEKDRLADLRELEYKEELRKEIKRRNVSRWAMGATMTTLLAVVGSVIYFIVFRVKYAEERYNNLIQSVREEHLTSSKKLIEEIKEAKLENYFLERSHGDLNKKYDKIVKLEQFKDDLDDNIRQGDAAFFAKLPKYPNALIFYQKANDNLYQYKLKNNLEDTLIVVVKSSQVDDNTFEKMKKYGTLTKIGTTENIAINFQVDTTKLNNTQTEIQNRINSVLQILVGEFRNIMRNAESFEDAGLTKIAYTNYKKLQEMLPTSEKDLKKLSNDLDMDAKNPINEYINMKLKKLSQ
jgi:hypothetical protein